MPSYYVETFGCRVNQADSAGIAAGLDLASLERAGSAGEADVVVLNTCTVTHRADEDVRKSVRRIARQNPDARVIVTGCYAQRDPAGAARLSGVAAVVGNAHKRALPILIDRLVDEMLDARTHASEPIVIHSSLDGVEPPPVEPVTTVLDRTRPFVKIQDGCDASCTYCIIPSVRGRARSAEPAQVLDAIRTLVVRGYQEIVLAGVHLGTYGRALDAPLGLSDLVKRALDVPGLSRLRLSCIEPMAFPIELASIAAADPRLCPHFHLPLQSGSDRILKRMVRPYGASAYVELLQQIRARLPGVCLGSDVIVGFPGERDDDFEATLDTVAAAGLDYVHTFSYSDREGTASTRLDGKVDPRVIKARAARLIDVGKRAFARFLDRQIGRELDVITLLPDDCEPGWGQALAGNYAPVRFKADLPANVRASVRIVERDGAHLFGRVSE